MSDESILSQQLTGRQLRGRSATYVVLDEAANPAINLEAGALNLRDHQRDAMDYINESPVRRFWAIPNDDDRPWQVEYLGEIQPRELKPKKKKRVVNDPNINQGDTMSDQAAEASPFDSVPFAPNEVLTAPPTLQELTLTLGDFKDPARHVILLNDLMEKRFISPKAKENDNSFLTEQTQCLEVILQLAGDVEHSDSIMLHQFIQPISRSNTRRLVSTTAAMNIVFHNHKVEIEKAKIEAERLERLKNFDKVLKEKMMVVPASLPKIAKSSALMRQLDNYQVNLENNTYQIEDLNAQIFSLRTENTGYIKQIREIRAYLKNIHGGAEDLDELSEFLAFTQRADGVKFPFKFIGIIPQRNNSEKIRFLFSKDDFTLRDKDTEIDWLIPKLNVIIDLTKSYDTGLWSYGIMAPTSYVLGNNLGVIFPYNSSDDSRNGNSIIHPHIKEEGHICLGNAAEMLQGMATDISKIEDSLLVINTLMNNYNPSSPYQGIVNYYQYSAKYLRNIALNNRMGQDSFTKNLSNKVFKGEITFKELFAEFCDKNMQIVRHRLMTMHLANGYTLENWGDAGWTIDTFKSLLDSTSESYSWSTSLKQYRPFSNSDDQYNFINNSKYFMNPRKYGYHFGNFYELYYINSRSPEANYYVQNDIIEALEIYNEIVKADILKVVEIKIKNLENCFTNNYDVPFSTNLDLGSMSFKKWFTEIRKK